ERGGDVDPELVAGPAEALGPQRLAAGPEPRGEGVGRGAAEELVAEAEAAGEAARHDDVLAVGRDPRGRRGRRGARVGEALAPAVRAGAALEARDVEPHAPEVRQRAAAEIDRVLERSGDDQVVAR